MEEYIRPINYNDFVEYRNNINEMINETIIKITEKRWLIGEDRIIEFIKKKSKMYEENNNKMNILKKIIKENTKN